MTIGLQRFIAYMERSTLNGREFAKLLGIHFTHLSKIRSGRRPGLDTVMKIEEHTGIPARAWMTTVRGSSDRTRSKAAKTSHVDKAASHAARS